MAGLRNLAIGAHHLAGRRDIPEASREAGRVMLHDSQAHLILKRPWRPAELEEAYLVNQVVNLYRHNRCVYEVRKMWHAARRSGLVIGRDQMDRLMRIAGVQGVRRGAHRTTTTTRDERAPRHPDLVKRGWKTPNRPDAIWGYDIERHEALLNRVEVGDLHRRVVAAAR